MNKKKQEISEAVGAKIRQLRKAQAMSQEELALKSELSPAYYGLVERGAKCPSVETIWKIAAGLEVPLPELLRNRRFWWLGFFTLRRARLIISSSWFSA